MSRSALLIGAPSWSMSRKSGCRFSVKDMRQFKNLADPELAFRVEIEWTPKDAIDDHDEEAHHRNAEHDPVKIAGFGLLGNISAEPVGLQMLVAPGSDLGDDAGVPRTARSRDCAGHIIGQHRRQRDAPPPQEAAHPEIDAGGA